MALTNRDVVELTAFRRFLHSRPELSGSEAETARAVADALAPLTPDRIIRGIGGHGVAAVFAGQAPGPTLLFRAELDALPIEELSEIEHRSATAGIAHLCGHEGHTTILLALARCLSRQRPRTGRVVLMFQPAEENGAGAAAVISDSSFAEIAPDYAFALHNVPGLTLGHVELDVGPANCASRGMRIKLTGHTAHASMPEQGISPVAAIASLTGDLSRLSRGDHRNAEFRLVTVTHVSIGEPAFGIAPGVGELWATLRTQTDAGMAALCAAAEGLVRAAAVQHRLASDIAYDDIFLHCENHAEAVAILRAALDAERIPHAAGDLPFRASEDFGRFGHGAKSAMFYLGAGVETAKLHTPTYDFPDDLIPIGARVFLRVVAQRLGLDV